MHLLLATVLFALAGFTASRIVAPNTAQASVDPVADRHVYSKEAASKYDFRFGQDKPFLPSNATTDTGEFLDPKSFPTAAYCSHCHQQSHQQWRQSAHANSFRAPWYQKNVRLLMDGKSYAQARHCEGCHNPIGLLSGSITPGVSQKRSTDEDGVTCTVCHSIKSVDQRGTGSYVMAQPAVMVDEQGKPIYGKISDGEILAHLDRHSKAVMQDFYKSSEFCTACHKAALPATLNDYKWQRAIFLSDEWQMSSFARQSPLPFYVKDSLSMCQTCHMTKGALTTVSDAGAKNGQLASHRWLGANTLLPTYYKYDEQLKQTTAFLQNGVFNVDLFALETDRNPEVIAPLGTQEFDLRPGDAVTVSVVIQNKGAAHSHVPEQRDMYESWVQFTVKDASGKIVTESGNLLPDGSLDPLAHSFTNRLINKEGTLNDLHQVWNNRVVAYNNTIQSGRSQVVRYQFRVPAHASGALTVTAKVNYRRFNQHFINFGLGEHYVQPVVTMVARTRTLNIGANQPGPHDAQDNAEWMRWNNYGIGLLDAQQYGDAAHAFEQVAKMRPDYADAFTNIALANFQWEKYDIARTQLERALAISPGNARALYYMALVERNSGNLEAAIDDLRQVIAKFPRSRDAHRELGFSLYQQHNYPEARAEYEALQAIDPDDLSAHYNLSILYRRLGLKDKAAVEAAAFADQKDDPSANTYALEYLRKHNEVSAESVPWHVHAESDAAQARSRAER